MTNNDKKTKTNLTHILVTGGSGYIGSHTVLSLLDNGFQVTILDKAIPNKVFQKYIQAIPEQCQFVQGDLLDLDLVRQIVSECNFDGVIHFAADPAYVSQEPDCINRYYSNNIISSINLIETCRELEVNNFVFSSTAAMYGIPDSLPIMETSKLQPINVYGYTKSVIEQMLIDFANAYGFSSVRLRYFNACGADSLMRSGEQHEPEVHLIPNILKSVGSDKVFKLFGNDYKTKDGTCVRDYIHVSDLASAHVKALELLLNSKENVKQVVNLGTGTGYTNQEIFETAEKVIGKKIPIEIVGRRAGDPDELVADNSKAKEILGWQTTHSSLENILTTAWQWEQLGK
jgi:UDP-glucose 4-epimerase